MNQYEIEVQEKGFLPCNTFPGAYPIFYVTHHNEKIICGECASKSASDIMHHDCHMEGAPIACDECGEEIESAYGDPYEDERMNELDEMRGRLESTDTGTHYEDDMNAFGDPFED